jgi:hypothetical protein
VQPVVYQNHPVRLEPREFTPEESAAYCEQQATRYRAREPTHGFVGRDLDILHIERLLLSEVGMGSRNLLLVRGMAGAGRAASCSTWVSGGRRRGWWIRSSHSPTTSRRGPFSRSWTRWRSGCCARLNAWAASSP